jgi:putative transposase
MYYMFYINLPMPDDFLPVRKRPVHLPSIAKRNRSSIQFVTVCVKGRRPILGNDQAHTLFRSVLRDDSVFRVGRYVIMPDHVHLFCAPNTYPAEPLSKWVKYWKSRFTSAWENDSTGKLWQRDFWDRELRTGESYSEKWAYVRENPVRAGLVVTSDQWPYAGELYQLSWHD